MTSNELGPERNKGFAKLLLDEQELVCEGHQRLVARLWFDIQSLVDNACEEYQAGPPVPLALSPILNCFQSMLKGWIRLESEAFQAVFPEPVDFAKMLFEAGDRADEWAMREFNHLREQFILDREPEPKKLKEYFRCQTFGAALEQLEIWEQEHSKSTDGGSASSELPRREVKPLSAADQALLSFVGREVLSQSTNPEILKKRDLRKQIKDNLGDKSDDAIRSALNRIRKNVGAPSSEKLRARKKSDH